MKRLGLFLLLVLFAGGAFAQQGFFIGGGLSLHMHPGDGEIESEDFDFTDDYYDDEPGLAMDGKMFYGVAPQVGFRINELFAVSGSYAFYFKKTGSDDTNIQNTDLDFESEWSQRAMRLMGHIYPFRDGSLEMLYFSAGFEFVSFTVDISGNLGDMQQGYYVEKQSEDDTGSANGLIFGLGYDYPVGDNLYFYGAGTYSMVKFDDELFSGNFEADAEINVGGIAIEAGLKYFFND